MVSVTYWGHSCFELSDGRYSLLIDPFLKESPHVGRLPARYLSLGTDVRVPLTAILVTHAHSDHLGDAVELARDNGAPIVAVNELALWCGAKGVQAMAANIGGRVQLGAADDVSAAQSAPRTASAAPRVRLVPAVHSSSLSDGDLRSLGAPCGFVVDIGGMRIYHAGDTALFSDMSLLGRDGRIDIALLPMGDRFTMGAEDAVEAARMIAADTVIPMHYGTFPSLNADAEGFKDLMDSSGGPACVIMQSGESRRFDRERNG